MSSPCYGIILAASASNSGKTTLSLGLQRLLKRRGLKVAPAKCGPDYIDPAFHAVASDAHSLNLDPWAMQSHDISQRALNHAHDCDFLFVEGVMGLFDGAAGGKGSTANLAKTLGLPIILVLDVKGQAQTSAAIARGMMQHDPLLNIAGVLLNRVGSQAHEALLREAFERLNIPVVGCVRQSETLSLPSRHLGLVQALEHSELSSHIDQIADHMAADIDMDQLLSLAGSTSRLKTEKEAGQSLNRIAPLGQHIAIARDEAFSFIYPHMLNDWKEQGAELSFFSPLADEVPDAEADAVYLPGGYPELNLPRLSTANKFRAAMQSSAENGKLIFAECGGFMTLGRAIADAEGNTFGMLDLLPLETSFSQPKLSLGYRRLEHASSLPFSRTLNAHEFHYATITYQGKCESLFKTETASGKRLADMGLRVGSVHGSFAHVISPAMTDC